MQHSTYEWIHIRRAKHTPNSTVSVLFKALCSLDLKRRGAAKWSNCVQIHVIDRKQTFPDTKVWIVQNVHNSVLCMTCVQNSSNKSYAISTFPWHTCANFPECAPINLHSSAYAARKPKIWWKARFRCYLRLSAQRTCALLRDPTLSKVTHYPQI